VLQVQLELGVERRKKPEEDAADGGKKKKKGGTSVHPASFVRRREKRM